MTRRLWAMFDAFDDGFALVDQSGVVLFANGAAQRRFRVAVGAPLDSVEARGLVHCVGGGLLPDGYEFALEGLHPFGGGRVSASAFRIGDGTAVGLVMRRLPWVVGIPSPSSQRTRVRADALVQRALRPVAEQMRRHGVTCETRLAALDAETVAVDAGRLGSALEALFEALIDGVPQGAVLRLSGRRRTNGIVLSCVIVPPRPVAGPPFGASCPDALWAAIEDCGGRLALSGSGGRRVAIVWLAAPVSGHDAVPALSGEPGADVRRIASDLIERARRSAGESGISS